MHSNWNFTRVWQPAWRCMKCTLVEISLQKIKKMLFKAKDIFRLDGVYEKLLRLRTILLDFSMTKLMEIPISLSNKLLKNQIDAKVFSIIDLFEEISF